MCKIVKKKNVDQSASKSATQIDFENVTIHDNF